MINENTAVISAEKTTLRQAARFLRISESSLTHFLHDEYHTSFKELVIARRLDLADQLMKTDPALSIAEAARQSGFDDPHYFSRLYRKKRGFPPSFARGNSGKTGD